MANILLIKVFGLDGQQTIKDSLFNAFLSLNGNILYF